MKTKIMMVMAAVLFAAAAFAASMTVGESALARGVENRQPVDPGTTFPADVGKVYAFTHIQNIESEGTISHVWFYNGKEMSSVELKVRPPSFRTWSYKTIMPEWKGQWKVEVRGTGGEVLKTLEFTIQ